MNDWLEISDNNSYTINLGNLVRLLFHKLWIIIFAMIVAGVLFFGYASICITPLYKSSIKMFVNNSLNADSSESISSSDLTASTRLVDTISVILTSYPILSEVLESTGSSYTYEQLNRMISTTSVNDTQIFQVTVTSPDPNEAAELANAIADIAPQGIMDVVAGSAVKIVEEARVPEHKSSPNKSRYLMMGLLLGFIGSCAGIMIHSRVRYGVTMEDKLRRDIKDKSVLAAIPQMGTSKKGKYIDVDDTSLIGGNLNFAASEAYKLLRANIMFCFSDDKPYRVLGVTSSIRNEGKSTTAINLAYTLAQTGKMVCLIDCDLRLPSIAKKLKLKKGPGLSNLLTGQADSKGIFHRYTSKDTKMYILSAGQCPPNPSELLGSERMKTTLEEFGETFDYIILDLPPVGVVSDAMVVSEMIDGMLYVVREDVYDRRQVQESMKTLELVDTNILGMVVTHSTTQQKQYGRYGGKYGKYGKYGYGSYGDYGYDTSRQTEERNQ